MLGIALASIDTPATTITRAVHITARIQPRCRSRRTEEWTRARRLLGHGTLLGGTTAGECGRGIGSAETDGASGY